ncbi:FkbM family methyltransferase [Rhizobium sp. RHZ02]|uniref:FkbM family methyltransferase n=1 Tax=Rhizobium sp. RHZ02 TaxID=2769306 RepID=UPI00199BC9FD|nr:FkbM family methyltransferase [Rhizobium sp. RHZ02]MBD9453534.1 FkbM family methyltransferase [Rhizobium sp. RHZ02]
MSFVRNSHRTFEEAPISTVAVTNFTGDFWIDFSAMVKWCAANGNVSRHHRQDVFRMSVEPYGIDVTTVEDPVQRTDSIVRHALSLVENDVEHWQGLYEDLADLDSKMLLLNVVAYRAMGWRYVKMPLDSGAFWDCLATLGQIELKAPTYGDGGMRLFDLNGLGADVKLASEAFGVFNEFVYSQYAYRGRRGLLTPQEGDCVLDCGACFGGTTLFFADAVGPSGRVISYEFFPENVAVFKDNVALNPLLSDRITLVPRPVWIQTGAVMSIQGSGPATQVFVGEEDLHSRATDSRQFRSISIDDTVREYHLERVDLIKMDIEGSEMSALRGARETIRRFRPNLAICVYHKLVDFFEIPREIKEMNLGYKFYLQHSTVHGDETVIFATARGFNANRLDDIEDAAKARSRAEVALLKASEAEAKATRLEVELAIIRKSRSWRVTGPLRRAFSTLRRS